MIIINSIVFPGVGYTISVSSLWTCHTCLTVLFARFRILNFTLLVLSLLFLLSASSFSSIYHLVFAYLCFTVITVSCFSTTVCCMMLWIDSYNVKAMVTTLQWLLSCVWMMKM